LYLDQKIISSFDGERINVTFSERGFDHWVIMTHGIGEHSGRHHELAEFLSTKANICLYDLRGHGKSSGERAHVHDFFYYSRDLMEVLKFLQSQFSMKKFYLYGHSMGALVVSDFMQNHELMSSNILKIGQFYPERVFLSAPPIEPAGWLGGVVRKIPTYWLNVLAGIESSFKVAGLVDIYYLSHDVRVFEQYLKDPLNSTKLHSKLLLQITKRSRQVFSRPLLIYCPLFVIVGTKDRLVSCKKIQEYFTTVESKADLAVIEDGYHELHNEIDRYKVQFYEVVKKAFAPLFH
jgi:alpha-beta hydrolase superfamily lysophospholipase